MVSAGVFGSFLADGGEVDHAGVEEWEGYGFGVLEGSAFDFFGQEF